MLAKLRKDQDNEEGFTLIELLVVVIIIGILAAIAIPVFLNQRTKAWDSAAKSDVKNMATAQETYLTEPGNLYTSSVADLKLMGFSPSQDVLQCASNVGGNSYFVGAYHEQSKKYFYFSSSNGQLTEVATAASVPCSTSFAKNS